MAQIAQALRATRPDVSASRSLLFVPAADPRKVDKALRGTADIVVLDLEDAIAPSAKDDARAWVLDYVGKGRAPRAPWLRINAPCTAWGAADMAAVTDLPLAGCVVPKASRSTLDAWALADLPIIAIVETAVGLREAYDVARHPNVVAMILGAADLGAELGWLPRPDGLEMLHARSTLVVDSAAAGIRSPFDVVHLDIHDTDALVCEARVARSLGFGGKACIHPAQIDPVNQVFTPSEKEKADARRITEAYDAAIAQGDGVAVDDGRMIDLPVLLHARSVLAAGTYDPSF